MNEIETSLYSTLTGGTALMAKLAAGTSVYAYVPPRDADYPLVIFNLQAATDMNETPARARDAVYQVTAISDSTMKEAGEVDAEIDELLHGHTLTVTNWTNFWTYRETDIKYTETTAEGNQYHHAGGLYRIRITK